MRERSGTTATPWNNERLHRKKRVVGTRIANQYPHGIRTDKNNAGIVVSSGSGEIGVG